MVHRQLAANMRGSAMFCLLALNTLLWGIPVYFSIALKILAPTTRLRQHASALVAWFAQRWALANVSLGDALLGIQWDVRLPDTPLSPNGQYFISANHQSWNDIYALIRIFGRNTPFFKFFLKQQLIWVPVLGLVWWGLDYPFMKRYSREEIARNPALRIKDFETTRLACSRYANRPVAFLNFLEGTRFTYAKHQNQGSPYRHLLRPKAGGLAYTLAAMGGRLSSLLDVTIVYPHGARGLWGLLTGQVRHVIVDVRSLTIPQEFATGDYAGDPAFRSRIQEWTRRLWADKDQLIDELLEASNRNAGSAST